MSYGLHLMKDDNSGYFSYTGSIFQLKYAISIARPAFGTHTLNIPPAPSGFSYEIVPSYSMATFGVGDGPFAIPPEKLTVYYFPEASSRNIVENISITDAGVVTYIGGSGFISSDASYSENNNFLVYIRGKK
ncbi:MAG: hypothetical protein ACRCX2_22200 [Paraclostridium sp.]